MSSPVIGRGFGRVVQIAYLVEDIDEAVRRSVRTTGMAVSFTATTIVGGIIPWTLSSLRFQAEMALLLSILMVINMLGAITVVPAFYSILRPRVATALLTEEINARRPQELRVIIPQVDARLWSSYHTTHWPHHLTRTIMY